ncbi:MAG: hypothetical protein WBM02_07720 [bacterium]
MQGYLFPLQRFGSPDPYRILMEKIIPSAKRSILLVDPSPADEMLKLLSSFCEPMVNKRVLIRRDLLNLGDSKPPDIMKPDTRHLVQKACMDVRAIGGLAARLVVVDDNAYIISGSYEADLNWGVELNPIDAQPAVDYWNQVFNHAVRISDTHAMEIWDQYLDRFWAGKVHPEDIIALYNGRGAFVEIQVRIFSGYRQITLYPFASSIRSAPRGPFIRWKLINSKHFKTLNRHAARIHGLKSLGLIRDTPAGSYLLRSDTAAWDKLFREREQEFKQIIIDYLDKYYSSMHDDAFQDLRNQCFGVLKELKKQKVLLPLVDTDFIEEEVRKIFQKHYPDKETLHYACQARYILYGLHPTAANDRKLMDNLSSSITANVLL